MTMKTLNDEQRKFAEQNHDLVYKFLNENGLSESMYYDVVIFGYLCAVQEYCENESLRNFSFTTLAWKRMRRELFNYRQYLSKPKRSMPTISLQNYVEQEENSTSFTDIIGRPDDLMKQLESELLLHTLATKLPEREMRIIQMKVDGMKMHDIAKAEHITFHDIKRLLTGSYETVVQILLG